MNIQQLRALCEVVRSGMRVSVAAEALCKAQPVVSRQIKELEDELGVQLFHRSRNRVSGLTPAGRDIHAIASRILGELSNLAAAAEEHAAPDRGDLTISTTNTHARYSLPDVIERYSKEFPNVRLSLRQGNPIQAYERLAAGEADIAICTMPARDADDVAALPIYRVAWDVIAAVDHPLTRRKSISLETVAEYPIITHESSFSGQRIFAEALSATHASPFIFLEGVDSDVSKAYVKRGLAVAILAKIAYDPSEDRRLKLLNLDRLFRPSILTVCFRKQRNLRSYVRSFIRSYAPHLSPHVIDQALAGQALDIDRMARSSPFLERAAPNAGRASIRK